MTNQPDVTVAVYIKSGFINIAPKGKPSENLAVTGRVTGGAEGFPTPVSGPVAAV